MIEMAKEVQDPAPEPPWWASLPTHECALPPANNQRGGPYFFCDYCNQRWMLVNGRLGLAWVKS